MSDAPRCTFRFRSDAQPAEVRGDFIHFYHPLPLRPTADGWQETSLHLSPGIYRYKFRAPDGTWHLDPDNPRTLGEGGLRNNLLSIGGTEEPVVHAPTRPCLFQMDDGRVCVRAGLRRGAGAGLVLRYHEDGARDLPMRLVAEDDEHLLFEAQVPTAARFFEYLFVLPGGRPVGAAGGAGQAFRVQRSELRLRTPPWWRDAVLYTIFVDRFRRGGGSLSPPAPAPAPSSGSQAPYAAVPTEHLPWGGDLAGVTEALPYLRDLGVSVVHLTPLSLSTSAHRYDAIDPQVVDPALGGEAALVRLLEQAHGMGLRVLLDLALTHTSRDFFAFRDVRERGKDSPYYPWFHIRRHPFTEGPDPGYLHYQKGRWQEPLLRFEEEEVVAYLEQTYARFAALGADGFRVDAAADVPLALLGRLARAVRGKRPDAVLIGEVIPDNLHRYTAAGLDAATDFATEQALDAWLVGRRLDAPALAANFARRRFWRGGPGWSALAFSATHDQHRLLSRCGDVRAARLGHLLVLTRQEVPAIYYGDEVGLRCESAGRNFEDAWPDRQPMPWDESRWDHETLGLFRQALRLRRAHPALGSGDEEMLAPADPAVLAYRRRSGDEIVEVYLHGGEGEVRVPLAAAAPAGATVLLALGAARLTGTEPTAATLGPYAGLVVRRHAPAALGSLWADVVTHNRALCDRAFVSGQTLCASLPAHLYITVTESCNLRCQHCITDAPARTRDGRARTLQPWLLDALREALSAAEYFGFAHGGEALSAPIFWDLLRAIRGARGGRPYDAHLLTNGVLLTGEVTRRLIDLGVNSIAVSLDGASAASNDLIRLGGRFDQVAARVREAVAARQALGADLRLGISTVVARANVGELAALGRLAVELGVDWVKVEEMFPVNGFSRRQLVDPEDRQVFDGLLALRQVAEPAGLVIVDHLHPPAGCPCDAKHEPALRAFRAADDFANRARFHPCSMPWEQACVDPDGGVRPVDYHQPALGNLLDTPFPSLWNGEAMRRLRSQALRLVAPSKRLSCQRDR